MEQTNEPISSKYNQNNSCTICIHSYEYVRIPGGLECVNVCYFREDILVFHGVSLMYYQGGTSSLQG